MITIPGKYETYSFDPSNAREILRANGRFAIVYKGKRISDNSHVVIKKLHPRLRHSAFERKRFHSEFRPELKLFYSVRTLDLIESGDDLFLIREYAEGIPLDNLIGTFHWRRMRRRGELFDISEKILTCIKEIHDNGIVHADLKPSNFIYNKITNEVKVIDLGLSLNRKEINNLKRNPKDPLPFSFIYSAPEVMLNFPEIIDSRTDIFSAGIILYHLFSGTAPWHDPVPAVLLNLQMVYPLPAHKNVPSPVLEILQQATSKYHFSQPPNRYPELVQSLNLREAMEKRHHSVDELMEALTHHRNLLSRKAWFW